MRALLLRLLEPKALYWTYPWDDAGHLPIAENRMIAQLAVPRFQHLEPGGHSPRHWQTYFYDRRRNLFKEVDDFTGPIIKRNFKLPSADWIEVQVHGASADPGDIVNGHLEKRRLSALH